MARNGMSVLALLGSVLCSSLIVQPAEAVMFTLRPGSVVSKKPSYKAADRLDLKPLNILVEGPSLEQRNDFCLYRLFDRQSRPLRPEQAWIPCHSIDTLFVVP